MHPLRLAQHHRRQRDEVVEPFAPRRRATATMPAVDDRQREGAQVREVAEIALERGGARRVGIVALLRLPVQAPLVLEAGETAIPARRDRRR